MLCLWSAKGGAGCTVTSAAVALLAARHDETVLVDLAGDVALALGVQAVERPDGVAPAATPGGEAVPGPSGWGIAGWLAAPCPPPDALARFEQPLAAGLTLLPWGEPGCPDGLAWLLSAGPVERVAILARLLADDERRVVVDLGLGVGGVPGWREPFLDLAQASVLVSRACYLGLSRASRLRRPDGVILVDEPGRALTATDVTAALDVPVLAAVPADPAVARAVDSGLLLRRLPRSLRGLQAVIDGPRVQW